METTYFWANFNKNVINYETVINEFVIVREIVLSGFPKFFKMSIKLEKVE